MAASYADLGISAGFNLSIMLVFVVLYSFFSRKPINARVYFTKWFDVDPEAAERDIEKIRGEGGGGSFQQQSKKKFGVKKVLEASDWLWDSLFMPELEFIRHAGLDAFVFLRIHLLALKIFVPVTIIGFTLLIPLNVTDNYLSTEIDVDTNEYTSVDKLTLANISEKSQRLWAHVLVAYALTFWTCYLLRSEYRKVSNLRLDLLADLKKQPDQFTVLVRQVPENIYESVSQHVEHFFRVNHPDYYLLNQVVYDANKLTKLERKKKEVVNRLTAVHISLEKKRELSRPTHKTGCFGFCGQRVDTIDFLDEKISQLNNEIETERKRILTDVNAIIPSSFVSFRKRWGAAVAAQTQLCRDSSHWITDWAPEPRDVYWDNLSIPYVELSGRRLFIFVCVVGIVFLFLFPVTFAQSLANLDTLEAKLPWLKSVVSVFFIRTFLQGFLPGFALAIVIAVLPYVCKILSRMEGWVSKSIIERKAANKVYTVLFCTVFCGTVITGAIFQQIIGFIESPTTIPGIFVTSIPTKAMFFITFVMVDGWVRVTVELFRVFPLFIYHFQGLLLVRTPADREKAMHVKGPSYVEHLPRLLLYTLFGFVYAVSTPLLLPFLLAAFALSYAIFRNQLINVYVAQYESAASFWPFVHGRIIFGMIVQHIILFGILVAKKDPLFPALIVPLPILTIVWHTVFCKGPFENAFKRFSLEEAMRKDTIDAAVDSRASMVRNFLQTAYLHPSVQRAREKDIAEYNLWKKKSLIVDGHNLVPLKRYPRSLLSSREGDQGDTENYGRSMDSVSVPGSVPVSRSVSGSVLGLVNGSVNGTVNGSVSGSVIGAVSVPVSGSVSVEISEAEIEAESSDCPSPFLNSSNFSGSLKPLLENS